MNKVSKHGEEIRSFILNKVKDHPSDIIRITGNQFRISRQAVNRYMQEFLDKKWLIADGKTRNRQYHLPLPIKETLNFVLSNLDEDKIWRDNIGSILQDLSPDILNIWHYSFTEMVNNAIDHSNGTNLRVIIEKTPIRTEIIVHDDGIGIFRNIKEKCNLEDERHAVLELAKGKLTTDPAKHTGEGIFFTSRMMDEFAILSGEVVFSHNYNKEEDWISQREKPDSGTAVFLILSNTARRTVQDIFLQFASEKDNYGFTKTVVPVRLAKNGVDNLISRSQAQRLLARLDRFSIVIFDFNGVDSIGQSFADEVFRVFEQSHPTIKLLSINTVPNVDWMINHVKSGMAG